MTSYITYHRPRLEVRHYITDARVGNKWFNFSQAKLRDYVVSSGRDFCLVINGSHDREDAFILPYVDVKDFFSPDMLDGSHRWVGTVRMLDWAIIISTGGKSKEFLGFGYHNAYHLLQDAPKPLPEVSDYNEFA